MQGFESFHQRPCYSSRKCLTALLEQHGDFMKKIYRTFIIFFNCTHLHLCQRWLLRSIPCVWQSCFQIYISSHPASAVERHLFSIKIIFICLRGLGKCFLPTAAALAPPFRSRLIANLGLFHRVNHWLFSSVFLRLPSTTLNLKQSMVAKRHTSQVSYNIATAGDGCLVICTLYLQLYLDIISMQIMQIIKFGLKSDL